MVLRGQGGTRIRNQFKIRPFIKSHVCWEPSIKVVCAVTFPSRRSWMSWNRRIIARLSLAVFALVVYLVFMSKLEISSSKTEIAKQPPGLKDIVFWNEAYGRWTYDIGIGSDVFGCPTWQCETTDVREGLEQADAVIFNWCSWPFKEMPEKRLPYHRYVVWSIESTAWRFFDAWSSDTLAGVFNRTMTYRRDSDIAHPYGWF